MKTIYRLDINTRKFVEIEIDEEELKMRSYHDPILNLNTNEGENIFSKKGK